MPLRVFIFLEVDFDECDVIALVAPIHIQEQVLKIAGDKPVIMALSRHQLVFDEDGGKSKAISIF